MTQVRIKAGELRHRIQIQTFTESQNASGETIRLWPPSGGTSTPTWASVAPLQGVEKLAAMQVNASATHQVKMRYHEGLNAANRIVFNNRIFDINSVLDTLERRIEHVCVCQELAQP